MIYQLETLDGEKFVLDIGKQRWGRASSILASQSVAAAENALANYVYVEEGELIPMGGGVYNLDGRKPLPEKATEEQKKAPGAGFSTAGILVVLFENVCEVYLKPNVQVKDGSFTSNYLRELPVAERTKYVRHNILQEPVKAEEPKVAVE